MDPTDTSTEKPGPRTRPGARTSPGATSSGELTRRGFLGRLGILGAGSLLGLGAMNRVAATDDLARPVSDKVDHRWVMIFDLRRCDGCGECITGCQEMHYLDEDTEWIKVYEMTDQTGGTYFMPVPCQMCENAPCVRVCPVGATFHTADGGILVDQDVCIGCRMCMAACPFGVRVFNWDDQQTQVPAAARSTEAMFAAPQRQGTVSKCDNCIHSLRNNEFPACLEACSMEAIYVGDLVEDVATNGVETVVLSTFLRDNDAYRFKEELGTETRVYYIAGHAQDLEY